MMTNKINIFILSIVINIGLSSTVIGQTYNINTGGTINTCSGTLYDSGGSGGNYAANENYTMSFCSSTPGQCLSITFNSAPNLGTNPATNPRDRITIYDGPTTAYANIGNINSQNVGTLTFPLTVTSSTGCLTIRFSSNNDGSQGTGFAATLSCSSCPVQPVYNNPSGFVYTCNSLFYDSGGPSGQYGNGQNRTTKFCAADGTCIRVSFTSFSTESGWDILYIYDGNSTAAPLIGSYSGTNSPGVVTATSGCLTFNFQSDANTRDAGWVATVSCVPCGTPPPASQQNCNGGVTVCNNQTISGNSSGSGSITDLGSGNDGCLYGENQTTWWYFSPATSGTIGFTIDPVNNSDDYDFAIWGPLSGVTCPPASGPVRCSYSALTDQTGLGNGAGDLTEGSGGNSWVAPLAVLADEVYILVVDNFSETTQPYNLSWNLSGGATLDCTPLPVSFQEFLGVNKGKYNELIWLTASEFNNDYFIIERSLDGELWTFIDQLDAVGTTTSKSNYKIVDQNYRRGAVNYYRLSQVDVDGSKKELDVLSIDNLNDSDRIVKRLNLIGQEVNEFYHGLVIIMYEDGSIVKTFQ